MTFHYILYSISISSECNGYLFWQSKVFVRVSSLRPVPRVAGLSLPPQASPRITQPGCYPDRVVTQPGVTRGCYQARLLPARLLPEVVTRSGCYQARLLPGQVVTRPGCYQARLLPGQVVTRTGCYLARMLPDRPPVFSNPPFHGTLSTSIPSIQNFNLHQFIVQYISRDNLFPV